MTNRDAAIKVIKRLRKEGCQGLLAGGCVRDMLLKRTAKDYDVATDAHPSDVIKLFRRTIKIGAKFGVVMVCIGSQQVEVATFRTETGYADGRRPDKVEFTDAKADAARRDFTINGMFYDPVEKQVIDFVNGQADLKKRIIRTIGTAHKRFGEDYLRMLRAVRFAAQLDFEIERHTWSAICKHAGRISKISAERVAMELEAILTNPNRYKGANLLLKSGLADTIFRNFLEEDIIFGINVLQKLRKKVGFPLALAAFFADCKTDLALKKARALRLSNAQIKHLRFLLQNRSRLLNVDMSLAQLKTILASPFFRDLYELQRAIQKAQHLPVTALTTIKKRAAALKGKDLQPKPLLNGHELIALGAQPGPMVGLLAEEMYIAQLAEQLITPEQAKRWAKKWLAGHRRLRQ